MADEGMGKVIVTVAVALIIGVYVFGTIQPILENDTKTNESVGFLNTSTAAGPVSLALDCSPVIAGSYTIYNSSDALLVQNALIDATDYTLNLGTGIITNVTQVIYVRATYDCGALESAASRTAATATGTNTFNAFSLAAIVVIVVAAAAILRSLGMF